jgi:adenine-specific DNA-methyltransferase
MAAKRKQSGPTPVEAIVHPDKRTNIPTADARDFLAPEEEPQPLRYPRRPELDPQLVWRGKDAADENDLEVDNPPIYIQEKIDPRVLIENLRRSSTIAPEPELTLFDNFDGLNELDLVDFYRHDANWSNRMILGDSLQVMASLTARESLKGKVQMIYIDPPYGIRFKSNWQRSTNKLDVKDGKLEDASFEAEQIKAFRDTWELGIHSYLSYLRDRLAVARDLLTESGSCFVQIGDENVHLVRALMDEVFGRENVVSQIQFKTTSSATSNELGNVVNYLLWFARDRERVKYRQIWCSKEFGGTGAGQYTWALDESGNPRRATAEEVKDPGGVKFLRPDQLVSQRPAQGTDVTSYEYGGRSFSPGKGTFKTQRSGLDNLALAGRLLPIGNTLTYVRFLDDFPAYPLNNLWDDTVTSGFGDSKIYVVQTNTRVIERCMLMCTDPGDLVLDPTCGSGTTAYVAEQWGRRWITIDTSRVALALARQRLMGAKFPYYLLADSSEGQRKEHELTAKAHALSTASNDIRRGFVYERVQHITLKSIANNPDIKDGMSREEIDAAIKRHAEFEMLFDKPYVDNKKVRVTGPFTVESLNPHRSLAFAGTAPEDALRVSDIDPAAPSFEQTVLDNLAKAGVQNGRRNERLTFASIDPYAGMLVQAIATRADIPESAARPNVAFSIGPQYGTVSPRFIVDAAREAQRAHGVGLVCVFGFAFDPQALGASDDYVASTEGFDIAAERSLGPIRVLLVRMNMDLLMGEDLKKTGAGNLFTVFGEPDVDIRRQPSPDGPADVVVEILGVDVYDPTTGQVRSRDTDHIALWMIDTDYDGDSFFVRHCYFTGGNDPYTRLKRDLKADIDEEAWASLYRTVSRPFAPPSTGRIAVKVINDYGDEVVQVFDVPAES